jgi:YD repeat-containing protein
VIGTPITFNGSASYSPNPGGSIVRYEWDLDGNGTYETDAGSSPTVQKTWTTPYSGLIGLRVTDNDGLIGTSSTYAQVFVVDLWPEHYVKVSERRISTFVYEYTYKFDMRNRGNAPANNVKCTLSSWPAPVTVVDGVVDFGSIPGPSVKTSNDTFSYRLDRRIVVKDFQLRWKLEYDDAGGTHVIFVDFPLR